MNNLVRVRCFGLGLALAFAAATATIASGEVLITKQELKTAFNAERPTLKLPLPDGNLGTFRFAPTKLLETNASLPIRDLTGRALEDPNCSANIVLTPNSLSAQIFTPGGTYYFNSKQTNTADVILSASPATSRAAIEYQCLTSVGESVVRSASLEPQAFPNLLRTFRLAPAATAEFTEYHGSKDDAVLEVVTAISRASGIFYREFGISFELVRGFEEMVYTDPETDPYSSNDPSYQLIHEAQHAFDDVIGTDNYDVGILLTRGFYGLAYFSSVCHPELKGSSCIGLPEPAGDAFHVNLVTHELGHQFGAKHTFNSPNGLCAERRDGFTSFEPGTGSTIMSYSSFPCGDDSFQPQHDAYFHSESIKQISDFVNSGLASSARAIPRTNTPPFVDAGFQYTIPTGTPFALTATATDPENDTIFYCWEERDLGPARALTEPDDGLGPLFRSFPPTTNATRLFPRLELILADTNAPAEVLPSLARTMAFRVVVRDSQENGAIDWADTQVQVIDTGAPFRITSHTTAQTLSNITLVEWDVANTTNEPINALNVRISLSTNAGQSFDIILADSTANDGSEEVSLPPVSSSAARLKVEPTDNIFFDINDAPLSLVSFPEPIGLTLTPAFSAGGNLRISWESHPETEYVLEQSPSLPTFEWIEALRTNATGNSIEVELPCSSSNSYYRVVRP